jgi:hypothetical protein
MNAPGIKDASFSLIVDNAEQLIEFIYNHKDVVPYNKREIRVGLAIKVLLKGSHHYSSSLISPIIDDLENMLYDDDYLNSFDDPEKKRVAISSELSLMNKYVKLDDTITLNTVENRGAHTELL